MYYIGVDLGTSAVKLLLMQADGTIEKIVSKEYPIAFPHPGWSEQNPEDWYTESIAGLLELTQEIDKSQIGGISFGGHSDCLYSEYRVRGLYRTEDSLDEGE